MRIIKELETDQDVYSGIYYCIVEAGIEIEFLENLISDGYGKWINNEVCQIAKIEI